MNDAKSKSKSKKLKPPKEFVEFIKTWKTLRNYLTNFEDIENVIQDLENEYQLGINASCYAFSPNLVIKPAIEIDRFGETLHGPVYTCEKYEWPMESGYPMVPLIQLDLANCSVLGGEKLGDGLLQVFMGHGKYMSSDSLVRIIPRNQVSADKLSPIPIFDETIKTFQDIDWAFDLNKPTSAIQIEGYSSPTFCMHYMVELQNVVNAEDLISIEVSFEEIKRFNESLKVCLSKFQMDGSHLFGTFSPIQYQASERGKPLFCFEEEDGFNFGMGNGQIFFEKGKRSKSMIFSFDWSCF